MPAAMVSNRRYLGILGGKMVERIDENTRYEYNTLLSMHLVNITFRKVEKNNQPVGETIQLHLIDEADYFILELWLNSRYAKAFYSMMENINLNEPFTIITQEKVKDGKKEQSLFIKQNAANIKWKYTRDNMQDCPMLDVKEVNGKIQYNDDLQIAFFLDKIAGTIIPALKKKKNPYPNHMHFDGIVGNEIAGNHFGKEERVRVVGPVSEAERNYNVPDGMKQPEDDLPF